MLPTRMRSISILRKEMLPKITWRISSMRLRLIMLWLRVLLVGRIIMERIVLIVPLREIKKMWKYTSPILTCSLCSARLVITGITKLINVLILNNASNPHHGLTPLLTSAHLVHQELPTVKLQESVSHVHKDKSTTRKHQNVNTGLLILTH